MNKLLPSLALGVLLCSTASALSVSVKQYGAKGDGKTDDTAAIMAASHAVAQAGGYLQFPPGTYMINPNKGFVEIGSNMSIWGTGTVRVIPGTGVFDYIIGAVPQNAAISNVQIRDITIDANVLNNPGELGGTESTDENILTAYGLSHLLVSYATFYVSGPYAIRINDFLTVQNSKFYFEQRPEQKHFDNSALLLEADKGTCSITNNFFQGLTIGAGQAVEIHYSANCVVSNNNFDNYVTAVLPEDNYSLTFTNNTVTRAEVAVSLWSQHGLDNVSITNNTISLDTADRQSVSGAGVMFQYCDSCSPMGSFHNVTITGNTITYEPDARQNSCVSCFMGIGLQTTGNIDAVTIKNNTITNAPVRAIQIGSAYTKSVISNVTVEDNTIVSPGNNVYAKSFEAGINLSGAVQSVSITGNTIKNEADPFTGNYGLSSDDNGKYQDVVVTDNSVQPIYKNHISSSISYH